MRILLLLSDLDVGGTQRHALLLSGGLARRGHEVHLFTFFDGGALAEEARALPGVILRSLLGERPHGPRGPRATSPHLFALGRALGAELARARPDLLHSLDYASNLLAARAVGGTCVPLVWGLRNSGVHLGWKQRVLRRLGAFSRGRVDLTIANSEAGAENARVAGYLSARSLVIENGIDAKRFAPRAELRAKSRARFGLAAEDHAIGLAGRLTPEKDHANLLAAAAELAGRIPRLVVLLGTPQPVEPPPVLERLASSPALAGRVHWHALGREVEPFYAALDLYVSASRAEGFPNVVAEAMASALPLVATDVGATAALVGDAGTIVPARDPAALARAIEAALGLAPSERAALGLRARARVVERFTIDALIERTERAFAGVLAQAR